MKTVVVTGANKGLGYETAKVLLGMGFYVFLGCRNAQLGRQAVDNLQAEGLVNCELLIIDTADQASVANAAVILNSKIKQLDILINNAAILGRRPDPANPLNIEDVRAVFNTNLFGTIMVIDALMPLLKKSAAPRIVNVTSTTASLTYQSDPSWEHYHAKMITYPPSKTALNAYTVALAYQYRDTNFKINCVTPGHTSTDLNGHSGGKPASENCKILVKYALLDDDGPTGRYFGGTGEIPW